MEEAELVARSQRGEVAAFNELVRLHQDLVYNLALRLTGDREAAADASQEAFLSAFRHVRRFRGGSFRAWLLRIAANASRDQLRRRGRRREDSLEAALLAEPAAEPADPGPGPEDYALRRELGRRLQQGLASLPLQLREAVVLRDVQGLSYEEVAGATGVPLGTVKSRLSRARLALRDFLRADAELFQYLQRLE